MRERDRGDREEKDEQREVKATEGDNWNER